MTRFDDHAAPDAMREGLAALLDRLTPVALAAALLAPALVLPRQLFDPTKTMGEFLIVGFAWLLIAMIGTARALRGEAVLGGGGPSKSRWLLGALAGWLVLSLLWGVKPSAQWSYALTAGSYLLATQSVLGWLEGSPERKRTVIALLAAVAFIQVAVSLAQMAKVPFFKLRGKVAPGGLLEGWLTVAGTRGMPGIPKGMLGNPNYVAELMALLTPVLVGAALTARHVAARAALGVLAVLGFTVIVGAGTRAAFVGIGGGAVLALAATGTWRALHPSVWWSDKTRRLVVLATLVAVVGLGAATGARLAGKLGQLGDDTNISGRLDNWKAGLSLVGDRPLHGHGLGAWKLVGNERLAKLNPDGLSTPSVSARLYQLHNEPLQGLVELGLVGVLLAFGALLFWVRETARNESLPQAMRFGVVWGVLAVLLAGCFGFPFHIALTAFATLLVVAVGLSRDPAPDAEPAPRLPSGMRWGYAAAVLVLTGVIGWLAMAKAQWPVYQASRFHYLASGAEKKNRDAGGLDILYGMAARHDRYKPLHVMQQMEVLARAGRYKDVLAVYDANQGEGLGMDAELVRGLALAKLGRVEEAIVALKAAAGYYGPKDRNYRLAYRNLAALGVKLPKKELPPPPPKPAASAAPAQPEASPADVEDQESPAPAEEDGNEQKGEESEKP